MNQSCLGPCNRTGIYYQENKNKCRNTNSSRHNTVQKPKQTYIMKISFYTHIPLNQSAQVCTSFPPTEIGIFFLANHCDEWLPFFFYPVHKSISSNHLHCLTSLQWLLKGIALTNICARVNWGSDVEVLINWWLTAHSITISIALHLSHQASSNSACRNLCYGSVESSLASQTKSQIQLHISIYFAQYWEMWLCYGTQMGYQSE